MPDEPTFLYEGLRVARGELPYRDIFNFIGPGTFYLVAALIKLCGGLSIAAMRLLALAVCVGCLILTRTLTRPFLDNRWFWVLALFYGALLIPERLLQVNHHLFSAFTGLLALWFLQKAQRPTEQTLAEKTPTPAPPENASTTKTIKGNLFLAGISAGLCLLFTQTLGLAMGALLGGYAILWLWKGQGKRLFQSLKTTLFTYGLGIMLPIALTCLYFWSQGAWNDFLYSLLLWPLSGGYGKTTLFWYFGESFPRLVNALTSLTPDGWGLLKLLSALRLACVALLPVLGILGVGELLLRRWLGKTAFSAQDWRLFLLYTGALAFFITSFSNSNAFLIGYHGWLLFALGLYILSQLGQRHLKAPHKLVTGLIVLFALQSILVTGLLSWTVATRPPVPSYGTLEKTLSPGTMILDGAGFGQLISYIHNQSPPGKASLFVFNHAPQLYFLTGLDNPTPFQMLMAVYSPPEQVEKAAQALARHLPQWIVYDQSDAVFFREDPRALSLREVNFRLTPIWEVIEAHYQPVGQAEHYLLFRRKDAV